MMHIIDNRNSTNANRCEWILIDDREGKEPMQHDFSTEGELLKFIGAMKIPKEKTTIKS